MEAVQAVHLGESGAKVTTLHENLTYLIENQPGMVKKTREMLGLQLAHDQAVNSFGTATAGIVGLFQYQVKKREDLPKKVKAKFADIPLLRPDAGTGNGDVDDLTAEALNWLVKETRAFKKGNST